MLSRPRRRFHRAQLRHRAPGDGRAHVRWLGESWPGRLSVQPNAGLPELVDGEDLLSAVARRPRELLARALRVTEDGVNMIGGCCGTDRRAHCRARRHAARGAPAPPNRPGAGPARSASSWVPSTRLALRPGAATARSRPTSRSASAATPTAAASSAQHQEAGDWDACVAMGVDQVKEGSHAIDLCTAFVGRNESAEMVEVAQRMRGSVDAPLVVDPPSTRCSRRRSSFTAARRS